MQPTHPDWLFAQGITDLIEVAAGQKYPVTKGWLTSSASQAEVALWTKRGSNVGLRSARFPGVDIDVTDVALAEAIMQHVQRRLGPSPVRTGAFPKILLPYRTEAPFPKRRIVIEGKGAVEVLGDGQQYVVWGRHPSGATYKWLGGTDLSPITAEDVDALLGEIAELMELMGETVSAAAGAPEGVVSEKAPSSEAVAQLLRSLPNDDLPYDEWCAIAHAVKGAMPEGEDLMGLEIFSQWSAKAHKHIPAESERVYNAAKPKHAGWQSLMARAQRQVPTAAAVAEFSAPGVAPAPKLDDGEQMASLLGSAEKPFLLEYESLQGQPFLDRWAALEAAAAKRHPLAVVYETRVLSEALSLRSCVHDRTLFTRALGARVGAMLRNEIALDATDVRLLLDTAWLDMTEPAKLANAPRKLKRVDSDVRGDDLVADFIPGLSLVGIAGPVGSGKSWIAGALSLVVARGGALLGREASRHGPVWYFASEYASGVYSRIARDQEMRGAAPSLTLLDGVPDLTNVADVMSRLREAASLATVQGAPALVIIDIFRDAMRGDENDSGEVSRATRNARMFSRALGSAVVIVHHTSKANPNDPRGSSAFEAELDALYITVKTGERAFRLETRKHREGKFPSGRFSLIDSMLVEDEIGDGEEQERSASVRMELARRVALEIRAGASVREVARDMMGNGMDYGCGSERSLRRMISEVLHQYADQQWLVPGTRGASWAPGPIAPPETPIPFGEAE